MKAIFVATILCFLTVKSSIQIQEDVRIEQTITATWKSYKGECNPGKETMEAEINRKANTWYASQLLENLDKKFVEAGYNKIIQASGTTTVKGQSDSGCDFTASTTCYIIFRNK